MPPGGIRTYDLRKRAAADLRLRPRGHWDRLHFYISIKFFNFVDVYMYRTQGFIFRKTVAYTVTVRYVLHESVSAV